MIKKVIAIYPGRFQPFGMQHKIVYDWAAKKFGDANTFIATSNKTDNVKSPFNFIEKKSILRLFNLQNKLQEVKNTYNAVEITSKFNENTTAVVYVVGEKDRDRLSKGKYFLPYPGDNQPLNPYSKNGYYIIGPKNKEVIPGHGEMNGTNVRKVLSSKLIPVSEKHKLFKYIFGTYSKPMADFIINKLMSLQETTIFSKSWWKSSLAEDIDKTLKSSSTDYTKCSVKEGYMSAEQQQAHNAKIEKLKAFLRKHIGQEFAYNFNEFPKTVYGVKMPMQESLLNEGGAGGHVLHPFDLPQVKTGKDLISVFNEVAESLKVVPARIKVDGVNTTLKLVTRNGKLQFAMDRGSKKEEDLQGVTVKELGNRFPEGHGMLKIGKIVLTAFNSALPKIASDLKAIGMSDPNILLNLETVLLDQGKANVIGYERNFFAIHGLMKSEMVNGRRVIKEIPVNAQAIEKIVEKAQPVMNKIGFDLYGFKKLQPKIKQTINYSGALNSKFTVKYNDNKEVSKSLSEWLNKASNPINDTVKLNTGKSEPVMTKKYYLDVLNQSVNLDDLTTDPKEQKKIIDAAVFYHATVVLGDVILKSLTSEVGDVENHEGIMIRDNSISKTPFKITGHFIVQGMTSGFHKK